MKGEKAMKPASMKYRCPRKQYAFLASIVVIVLLIVSGCIQNQIPSDSFTNLPAPSSSNPYKEIYDAGLTKYVGKSYIRPASVTPGIGSPRIDVWNFAKSDTERGPLCMRGSNFFIETRDGSSNDLFIFLEGGGVCLNEICAATSEPLLNLTTMTFGNFIGIGGVLDHNNAKNPLRNFNVVHIPYCDGAIFMGDVDRILSDGNDSNGTQDMAYQRGLQNLTAAFELAKLKYPNPSRIVLAGTSGGGYGILAGTALARLYYPSTELSVIADSGAPMMRDNDKDFIRRAMVELNVLQYIPFDTCPDCIANGHLTKIIAWALARDTSLRVATMSYSDDPVIGTFYMQSPPPIFRNALLRETSSLKTSFGNRVHRFITPGSKHLYLLDAGIYPTLLQKVVFSLFGTIFLSGNDVTSQMLSTWIIGSLYEKGTDFAGKKVSGHEWLTGLLNNPDTLQDVVNVE